jgi:hypothetical protein
MAFGAITDVVIFDEKLYRPGGMVHRWMTGMVAEFVANAIAAAPMRSGALKAGIEGSGHAIGPKQMAGHISSHADHSLAVIKGTHGPIRSTTPGKRMAVGRNLWPPVTPRHEVSGQAANNFMFHAWRRTAWNHRSIRGIRMPDVF